MLDKDLIFNNLPLSNFDEVINYCGEALLDKGYVKNTYIQAVKDREKLFPTGIEVGNYGVAIPHTDPEHVIETSIVVATLENEVAVHQMINPEETVSTRVFFILAVKNPKEQMSLLSKLMGIMQSKSVIEKLQNAMSRNEIQEIINNRMEELQ